jgi:hypothetical protein
LHEALIGLLFDAYGPELSRELLEGESWPLLTQHHALLDLVNDRMFGSLERELQEMLDG